MPTWFAYMNTSSWAKTGARSLEGEQHARPAKSGCLGIGLITSFFNCHLFPTHTKYRPLLFDVRAYLMFLLNVSALEACNLRKQRDLVPPATFQENILKTWHLLIYCQALLWPNHTNVACSYSDMTG